jgi:hypothetical protein
MESIFDKPHILSASGDNISHAEGIERHRAFPENIPYITASFKNAERLSL